MIFGLFGVGVPRMGYFALILRLVVPLRPAALPVLVEVCYVFAAGVWGVGLLVAVVLVGCIGSVKGMRLMCTVLSTLSTLLLLLLYSFVGVSSLLQMCLRVSGTRDFSSSRWSALVSYWEAVCRHGPCGPISSLEPGDRWIPPDLHGFFRWVLDSLELLNGFLQQVVVSRRGIGIRKWSRWLREELSSRPYVLAQA